MALFTLPTDSIIVFASWDQTASSRLSPEPAAGGSVGMVAQQPKRTFGSLRVSLLDRMVPCISRIQGITAFAGWGRTASSPRSQETGLWAIAGTAGPQPGQKILPGRGAWGVGG